MGPTSINTGTAFVYLAKFGTKAHANCNTYCIVSQAFVHEQRWALPIANRHYEQQMQRAAWLDDKARIALQAMT